MCTERSSITMPACLPAFQAYHAGKAFSCCLIDYTHALRAHTCAGNESLHSLHAFQSEDQVQGMSIAGVYLKSELVKFLRIPEAVNIGVKEAMLGEDKVCSLHGSKCPAKIAHVYSRMPAIKNLCEFLHRQPCLSTTAVSKYFLPHSADHRSGLSGCQRSAELSTTSVNVCKNG